MSLHPKRKEEAPRWRLVSVECNSTFKAMCTYPGAGSSQYNSWFSGPSNMSECVFTSTCALSSAHWTIPQPRVRLEAEAMLTLIQLCEDGSLELIMSAAHEIENGQNPYSERRAYANDVLVLARHRVPTDPSVAERAANYVMAGLARLDALHLAAAVEAMASYFCTTDDILIRRSRALNTESTIVVSPIDLIFQLDLP